ncbi:hypothetical protein D9M71_583570 [compost metagenome]
MAELYLPFEFRLLPDIADRQDRFDSNHLADIQRMPRRIRRWPVFLIDRFSNGRPGFRFGLGGNPGDDDLIDQFGLQVLRLSPALKSHLLQRQHRRPCISDAASHDYGFPLSSTCSLALPAGAEPSSPSGFLLAGAEPSAPALPFFEAGLPASTA